MWSKAHDILFCREILLSEPFKYKVRSNERKKAWESITDNLHCIQEPKFKVSLRSVRDRYLPHYKEISSTKGGIQS